MNKDNLITWFWEKFNSCYLVKHEDYPESIFMYYDLQYVRKLKLAKISGKEIYKNNITGDCLFEQDWKNKLFYCNFDIISNYLYYNYSYRYPDIHQFVADRLEEHSKMSMLTPKIIKLYPLEEHSKMSMLTPNMTLSTQESQLEEHSKMSMLKPRILTKTLGIISC